MNAVIVVVMVLMKVHVTVMVIHLIVQVIVEVQQLKMNAVNVMVQALQMDLIVKAIVLMLLYAVV